MFKNKIMPRCWFKKKKIEEKKLRFCKLGYNFDWDQFQDWNWYWDWDNIIGAQKMGEQDWDWLEL